MLSLLHIHIEILTSSGQNTRNSKEIKIKDFCFSRFSLHFEAEINIQNYKRKQQQQESLKNK